MIFEISANGNRESQTMLESYRKVISMENAEGSSSSFLKKVVGVRRKSQFCFFN